MTATPLRSGWLFAALGFIGTCLWGSWCIRSSASSTAAVGYVFLPFRAAHNAVFFFLFGFCAHQAVRDFKPPRRLVRGLLCAAVALLLAVPSIGWFGRGLALTAVVRGVRTMTPVQIENFLQTSPWRENKFALGAALENPGIGAPVLHQIAEFRSPGLHERMGSAFPIMGKNTRGFAVMRLVARHPNVDTQTLALLAESPNDYVLGDVAANAKTPPEALERLAKKGGYLVEWGLARNPNAAPETLHRLARSSNDYTRAGVAGNRSATAADLEKLAKDEKPFVRDDVMVNPACPPELKKTLGREFEERRGMRVR